MKRGLYHRAGPVTIRSATGTYVQPAYSPKAYWQVVCASKRESEAQELGNRYTARAQRRRTKLAEKIKAGQEALQQARESRRSG